MKVFILCLLFIITSCVSTQNNNPSVSNNSDDELPDSFSESQNNMPSASNDQRAVPQLIEKEISNVGFCKLLQTPEKFEQQPVRIKAIFRRGFEKSEFYSLNCLMGKQVWVQGGTNTKCANAGKFDATNFKGDEQTVGVVVVGKLTGTKGNYGHLGAGDYLFHINCVERYEVLDHKSNGAQYLTTEQRRKVEKFERSN
jgi:hypothetical protein